MHIALVRGKHLNPFETQSYNLLQPEHSITAFGSLSSDPSLFFCPVKRLLSAADITFSNRYAMGLCNRLLVDVHYLFGLEEWLKGFDIAHTADTYYSFTWQCIQAKKKGYVKRVVATAWENIPYSNEGIRGRHRRKQEAIQYIDLFLAVSRGARSALIAEGCNPDKIRIAYPGVDTNRFRPRSLLHIQPRGLYVGRHDFHILYVGRLVPEKGIWVLLDAFTTMLPSYPHLKLRFCGKGSEEGKLRKSLRQRGLEHAVSIEFSSYADLHSVYQWADCCVVPSLETSSWKEQFGMVLIEALASGLPVIAFKSGAIDEILGSAGILCKTSDADDLAHALSRIVTNFNLRQKMVLNARNRAESVFSLQKASSRISEGYAAIYTG